MKFSPAMLTGKSRQHLQPLQNSQHFLQPDCLQAFQGLQQYASQHGFNLQPASSFRDFQRQQLIWNNKFNGIRKVHNDEGIALDVCPMKCWEKAQVILRWSALPGASRHHWGTEIDVFDPNLLPQGQPLQLEPWEYQQGGYFSELSQFLSQNLAKFDFALPFMSNNQKKIGPEPWHISYIPIASQASEQFSSDILLQAWENEDIAGKRALIENLEQIFIDYVV